MYYRTTYRHALWVENRLINSLNVSWSYCRGKEEEKIWSKKRRKYTILDCTRKNLSIWTRLVGSGIKSMVLVLPPAGDTGISPLAPYYYHLGPVKVIYRSLLLPVQTTLSALTGRQGVRFFTSSLEQ